MGMRREAREKAVQFLFQHDLNPPENLEEALAIFWESQRPTVIDAEKKRSAFDVAPAVIPPPTAAEATLRMFSEPLIRGVLENLPEIDAAIVKAALNWDIRRMAAVDRNILRLAVHEMLHRLDIPPVVSINEAVEVAKKFSTDDSGKFVNGLLDKIKGELLRNTRYTNT
jgi:N utilization substance protein B